MTAVSEKQIFDALATLTRAFGEGGVPDPEGGESALVAAMDAESRGSLGEAALAVAFGAFAASGSLDGPMHALMASLGLMAVLSGEEPDPPAEIMAALADGTLVDKEIERAGEALDREHGRGADCDRVTAAIEARILGNAILLAGCTLPEDQDGQAAVRLRAARILAKLAAGLLTMNMAAAETSEAPPGS